MDNQNEPVTTTEATPIEAPAEVAETVAAAAPRTRRKTVKVEAKIVEAVKKTNARRVKTQRKPRGRKAATEARAPKAAPAAAEPIAKETTMNFDPANWMNLGAFTALPGADRFQALFADAGSRSQQALEKGRVVAEQMTDLTRANVEALVEAGRIAAAGGKTLAEDAIARGREGLEQAAAQVKTLAEAGTPTEFFQLQSEIARTQFDRMVAETSRMTESLVKLAGEAIQPLSNRAALNAEKINELTA